jgi:hypothetical protein
MPALQELWETCVIASVSAVTVVLVVRALGFEEHATVAAAVSASVSAVTVSQWGSREDDAADGAEAP